MSLVTTRIENSIGYLGMNRPDKRNSLSPDLVEGILTALKEYNSNPEVKAIILYGEGKAFSAGGDIETLNSLANTSDLLRYMGGASEVAQTIKNLDKLVVSAVHGFAAGAGFSIALASDFIVAAKDAKFISSFTNVGLIPDLGLMKNLVSKVPSNLAKQWIISGKPIFADEAYSKGLVNKISESNLLEDTAEFSRFIVSAPPLANQFVKFMTENAHELSDRTNFMQENIVQSLLLQTDDNAEGMKAFFEKRKPEFKGN